MWLAVAGPIFMVYAPLAQAAPSDGDYVRMSVPDMRQAVDFFSDVMNCEVVNAALAPATGRSAAAPAGSAESALMNCAHGIIVELRAGPATVSPGGSASSVAFVTNDAVAATAWLRRKHIAVLGTPAVVHSGPNAGKLAVNFLSPWGQPLQLIGPAADDPAASARLAVQ